MLVKRMPLGVYQANCYILIDEDTQDTVVIDPAGEFGVIRNYLDTEKCIVKGIILTHSHADHIGALKELKEYTKAPVYVHEKDAAALGNAALNMTNVMGKEPVEEQADHLLKDGDVLKLGDAEMKMIHTPGHTPGSICIYTEGRLYSGDTLFAGSIGRTDLPGGSYKSIVSSLKKLVTLPEDTQIFPGHGPSTTIQKEKRMNPFLRF